MDLKDIIVAQAEKIIELEKDIEIMKNAMLYWEKKCREKGEDTNEACGTTA